MAKKREIKTYFTADIDKFTAGTRKASGSVDKFEKTTSNAAAKLKRSFSGMRAALAGVISVGAISVLTKNSLDAADAIQKVAQSTGFTIGKVQELRFAADQTGVSMQAIDDVMFRFTKRLGLARTGVIGYSKVYSQLGVDINQSKDKVFNATIDALANMEDQTKATALATRVFGDDAKRILNTFSGGSQGLQVFADQARELGLVLSDELVNGAAKANDQLSIMKQVVSIQFTKVFLELAPAITAVGQAFADSVPKIVAFIGSFKEIKNQSRDALTETAKNLQSDFDDISDALNRRILVDQDPLGWTKSEDWLLPSQEVLRERLSGIEARFKETIERIKDLNKGGPVLVPGPVFAGPADTGETDNSKGGATEKVIRKQAEAYKDATGPASVYYDMQKRAGQVFEQTRTPLEQYIVKMKELAGLHRTGLIDNETLQRAAKDYGDQVAAAGEQIVESTKTVDDSWKELGFTFSSAFEDAIVSGGKARDILKGLEDDIIRIITRKFVTGPGGLFDDVFGSLFGGGGGGGGGIGKFISDLFTRASGGPVSTGTPYIVGEKGPELFTPGANGYITPNNQMPAGGVTVNNYITTPDANSFRQSEGQIGSQVAMAVRRAQRNL